MRTWTRALRKKLRSTKGDTLVETLAALLIAVLATTLLATMVMASTSVASSSSRTLKNVYTAESSMAQVYDWAQDAYEIKLGSTVKSVIKVYTFNSTGNNGGITFERFENRNRRPGEGS